jgi:hypothetical protein
VKRDYIVNGAARRTLADLLFDPVRLHEAAMSCLSACAPIQHRPFLVGVHTTWAI